MKKIVGNKSINLTWLLSILAMVVWVTACEEYDLPQTAVKADTTPPAADFSYASDADDFRIINFTNLSSEAITFMWDFGGGNTSTEEDPSFTFEGEGTYEVSLTATDGLGVSHVITQDVIVEEGPFQPTILEAGFEDNTLPDGTGDGRDSWRNSDLGGVIQITGSPVVAGDQGAKLTGEPSDQRIGYQEITVGPETNYDVTFIYTILSAPVGYITVDIVDVSEGTVTTHEQAQNQLLGSVTVNNQEDPQTYEPGKVSFNSGSSTKVAIYFHNEGSVESRLDEFAISIGNAGAVPPSAAFSAEQSEANFLEYTFNNTSLNAESYVWDFGDGNSSAEQSPIHTYAEAGEYAVMLTATSAGGLSADFTTMVDIQAPVTAAFTFAVDSEDYRTYAFTDASEDAVSLLWEFGDGFQFTGMNPTHTYDMDGTYTVTLTATSITGLTAQASESITVSSPDGPLRPEIINGNFDSGQDDWKVSTFSGGTTSPFNSSSDGSWLNYDGSDNGEKTPGAKWTQSTSAGAFKSADTRYAYQAITVTPNTEYILEYEYAIKDDEATDPEGGRRVVGEILNGHFADGADAAASSEAGNALATHVGTVAEGKFSDTVGTTVQLEFTSNASGQIAIWLWAVTPVDAFVDNVKVYPKE